MRTWFKGIALVAVVLALVACEMEPADPTDEVSASELIQGSWTVTKYQITYDSLPDNPITVSDSSDITFSIRESSFRYVCFPACLGIVKAAAGTYTMNETRKSINLTETDVELTPQYAYLASQLTGEWRATYRFPSRDRLRLDARTQVLSQGVFVQASTIIEADRD